MTGQEPAFESIVVALLQRWWTQQGQAVPDAGTLDAFARRLRDLVECKGLPPPLAPGEAGAPGGISKAEAGPLVKEILGGLEHPLFVEAARQLVKACFYPEFRICRDSFRDAGADGVCRRQQLERTLRRLSGVHCVDCPHWIELSAEEHQRFLLAEWHGDPSVFIAHREVFLPEDFRALRRWLHAQMRQAS